MDTDLTLRAKEFASKDPFPMKGFGPVEWWVGNAFMTAQAFRALLGLRDRRILGSRDRSAGSLVLSAADRSDRVHRLWCPGTRS